MPVPFLPSLPGDSKTFPGFALPFALKGKLRSESAEKVALASCSDLLQVNGCRTVQP